MIYEVGRNKKKIVTITEGKGRVGDRDIWERASASQHVLTSGMQY